MPRSSARSAHLRVSAIWRPSGGRRICPAACAKPPSSLPYEVALVAGRDQLEALQPASARGDPNHQSRIASDGRRGMPECSARCADLRRRGQYGHDDGTTGSRSGRAMLRRLQGDEVAAFLQRQSARTADFACAVTARRGWISEAPRRCHRHRRIRGQILLPMDRA